MQRRTWRRGLLLGTTWLIAGLHVGCEADRIEGDLGGGDAGPAGSDSGSPDPMDPEPFAIAEVEGKGGSRIAGSATFTERNGRIELLVQLRNAPPGEHGIHIHEFGDCGAVDGSSAGGHWNPGGAMHGTLEGGGHLGDIGNIVIGADGTGRLEMNTDKWSKDPSQMNGVLGRAIIIHANRDDGGSVMNGNAGGRIGCAVIAPEGGLAIAEIRGRSGSAVTGRATFVQLGDEVALTVTATNASPGEHGLHIHEFGDCSREDGTSTGGHWNPSGASHGTIDTGHLGDIGNITIGANGSGRLVFKTDKWSLDPAATNSVLGRGIILHANRDDGGNVMNGNAGGRIGCGVIGTPGGVLVAPLEAKSGSRVVGAATFTQIGDVVRLVVTATNATPGEHGLHIHEFGDCSAPDGTSTGGHWNPTGASHGNIDTGHLGDIGNITIGMDGTGRLEFSTDEWTLTPGATNSVLGRAIIFHANRDDGGTVMNGNAGGRQACGVIAPPDGLAIAEIEPKSTSTTARGRVTFIETGDSVRLIASFTGLTPGEHGVHIHDKGDCSAADGTSAGPHWDPNMAGMHGTIETGHLGDVGNVMIGADGRGKLEFSTSKWTMVPGAANSILGHGLIVHANRDDGGNVMNGNAGGRVGCAVIGPPGGVAIAPLAPTLGNTAAGRATFVRIGDSVQLTVRVSGATPGQHGLHIHDKGDCSAPDGTSAGPHWNPNMSMIHGTTQMGHLGDVGNITVAADGTGLLEFRTKLWSMGALANSVLGRGIILHANADDLGPNNNGNAGGRIACGAIALPGRTATATIAARSGSTVTGSATFIETAETVSLVVRIEGATPGQHGIHIHERGDCSAPDGTSAGGHWNPSMSADHGTLDMNHLGDIGNITVDANGVGRLELRTPRWSTDFGALNSVLGKAIIVHALADDLGPVNNGNAGGRQGCGEIVQRP